MTRVLQTLLLKLIFRAHLLEIGNGVLEISKGFVDPLTIYIAIFLKVIMFTILPRYGKNITCVKFAVSYTGLTEASKGYQDVIIISWSSTIRTPL